MDNKLPLLITISRQFGSGGSALGEQLAKQLDFQYLDREIIVQAAKKLWMSAEKLESIDEKYHHAEINTGIFSFMSKKTFNPIDYYLPASHEIFEAQSKIILDAASKGSAVIVGRCANYVLRNHPHCISIFLHADIAFRKHRIEKIYNLSTEKALKLMEATEKQRAKYLRIITNEDMTNACQYDFTLDTGVLGLERTEKIILAYINERYGE